MLALLAAVVVAVLLGSVYRRRSGRLRPARPSPGRSGGPGAGDAPGGSARDTAGGTAPPAGGVDPALLAELGVRLGSRATFVQFSSAFCAPCRATRALLGSVAAATPGVAHVEVDAESHLEAIRALDIRRTPTVLVLDPAGRLVRRGSGELRRAEVLAALSAVDAAAGTH